MNAPEDGTIRVICLGNELVADDGIGVRVGRVLRTLSLPPGVTIELRRTVGIELLDELKPTEALVFVDASRTGAEPGSCQKMEFSRAADFAQTPYCCHGIGIAEILRIAEKLSPERLPPRAAVVVIEGKDLENFTMTLTREVQEALPRAVEIVLEVIGAPEDLRSEGRRQAEKWKTWEPDITEVMNE